MHKMFTSVTGPGHNSGLQGGPSVPPEAQQMMQIMGAASRIEGQCYYSQLYPVPWYRWNIRAAVAVNSANSDADVSAGQELHAKPCALGSLAQEPQGQSTHIHFAYPPAALP